jgi:hypothetical protein
LTTNLRHKFNRHILLLIVGAVGLLVVLVALGGPVGQGDSSEVQVPEMQKCYGAHGIVQYQNGTPVVVGWVPDNSCPFAHERR